MENIRHVGKIGNYYGGLLVGQKEGKYYWIIVNWNTELSNVSQWSEISENLFLTLLKEQPTEKYEE